MGKNGLEKDMIKGLILALKLKMEKAITKEYDEYEELKFEGEYLNGQRNGKRKEYHDKKLIFEGEYLNRKKIRD